MTEPAQKSIQLSITKDLATATLGGTTVEVAPNGDVTVYTNDGVEATPAANDATEASTEGGTKIGISKDFNTVSVFGAKVGLATDGSFTVSTPGKTKIKPAFAPAP